MPIEPEAATKLVDAALAAAADRAGVIDPDVLRLVDRGAVTVSDSGDVAGAEDAISKLRTAKPHLFRDWSKLSEDDFDRHETESIRNQRAPEPRVHNYGVDAADLSDSEMESLNRLVRGRGDSYDEGVIAGARRRQGGQRS
jgi:hypothetical protein